MSRRTRPALSPFAAASLVAAGSLALGGCGGGVRVLEPLAGPAGARLSPGDFRDPSGAGGGGGGGGGGAGVAGAPQSYVPPLDPPASPTGTGVPASPNAAANRPISPESVEVVIGGPDFSGSTPPPVEEPALVDVKVGDINGRPIFANEFFETMGERLASESRLKTRRDWTADVTEDIRSRLSEIIAGELLRAEALEMLPQAQREAGLGRVIAREQDALRSRAGGSLAQAQRRLMEEEGLTLEEYLRQRQDASLVQLSIQELRQSVQVSGRDIRADYERNYDTYNPKPTARFREIVVPTVSTRAKDEVQAALNAGTPFEEVAGGPLNNSVFRAQGGLRAVEFEGEYRDANLLNNDTLNQAVRDLSPGNWVGPIEYGTNNALTAWIYLERLVTRGQSLYEAQITIAENLRRARTTERFSRMIERLSERASFTSEQEMIRALVEIALARYYPPGQPEPAALPGLRNQP